MRKGVKSKSVVCLGMAVMLSVSGIQPGMVRAEEFGKEKELIQSLANTVENDWKYTELGDGTLKIIEYIGGDTEVIIPSKISGRQVTSIGNDVFRDCSSLTSIYISEQVTSIGDNSFFGSNAFFTCSSLIEISVSEKNANYSSENGVLYDKYKSILLCYPAGKLGDIQIPEGVTSIGAYAFCRCSSLTNIEIPEGVTSIGRLAFYDCSSLISIDIPEEVTNIGHGAFNGCSSLTNIEIPEGITSIDYETFRGCSSLTSINIPESVTSIGTYAFLGCSNLAEILVDEDNENYNSENGVLYNKDKSILLYYPEGKLGDVQIREEITSIGDDAFKGCSGLTSIDIPEEVECIGNEAFSGCSSLTSINIPESVTSIGYSAFHRCENLTIYGKKDSYAQTYALNNNIPFKILDGENDETAGDNNSDAQDTTKPSDAPSQSEKPSGNTGSTGGEKPSDITNAPQTEKPSDSSPEQIITPDTVKTVQSGACEYEVTSTDTVTLTGLKKSKTKKLNIPKTITVNGTKYKVVSIADNAFKNAKLTSLTLGNNVKTIGTSAFENCKNLTKVTLGGSVTKINKNAFKNCKKLKNITIKSTKLKTIGKNAFKGIKSTAKIKVAKKNLATYKKLLKKAGIGKKVRVVK